MRKMNAGDNMHFVICSWSLTTSSTQETFPEDFLETMSWQRLPLTLQKRVIVVNLSKQRHTSSEKSFFKISILKKSFLYNYNLRSDFNHTIVCCPSHRKKTFVQDYVVTLKHSKINICLRANIQQPCLLYIIEREKWLIVPKENMFANIVKTF